MFRVFLGQTSIEDLVYISIKFLLPSKCSLQRNDQDLVSHLDVYFRFNIKNVNFIKGKDILDLDYVL